MAAAKQIAELTKAARELTAVDFKLSPSGPGKFVANCPRHPQGVSNPIKGAHDESSIAILIAAYIDAYNNGPDRLTAVEALAAATAPKAKRESKEPDLSALPDGVTGSLSEFKGKKYLFLACHDGYTEIMYDLVGATRNRGGSLQVVGPGKIKSAIKAIAAPETIAIATEALAKLSAERAESLKRKKDVKAAEQRHLAEMARQTEEAQFAEVLAAIEAMGRTTSATKLEWFSYPTNRDDWATSKMQAVVGSKRTIFIHHWTKPVWLNSDYLADNGLDHCQDPHWSTSGLGVVLDPV
jgi:hypothetical protein